MRLSNLIILKYTRQREKSYGGAIDAQRFGHGIFQIVAGAKCQAQDCVHCQAPRHQRQNSARESQEVNLRKLCQVKSHNSNQQLKQRKLS